jgi:hypothetical protein
MKSLSLNNIGEKFVIEQCQKMSLKTFLSTAKSKLKRSFLEAEISMAGVSIDLATSEMNNGGTRYWFACPICSGRVGVLYVHPLSNLLGCRNCLNLKYKKSQYKGMVEGSINN